MSEHAAHPRADSLHNLHAHPTLIRCGSGGVDDAQSLTAEIFPRIAQLECVRSGETKPSGRKSHIAAMIRHVWPQQEAAPMSDRLGLWMLPERFFRDLYTACV